MTNRSAQHTAQESLGPGRQRPVRPPVPHGLLVAVVIAAAALAGPAWGGAGDAGSLPLWTFRTSAVISGGSESSEPEGWQVYSPVALEIALRRRVAPRWDAELIASPQTREVEWTGDDGVAVNLGSLETLPLTLLVRWRWATSGGVWPYVGAGLNATLFWEKSGALDSDDLTPSLGPALQLGADFDLSPRVLFNVDVRWHRSATDLQEDGRTIATVNIHPATFGAGVGFRF